MFYFGFLVFALWIFPTVLVWAMAYKGTLVELLKSQVRFLRELMKRVY